MYHLSPCIGLLEVVRYSNRVEFPYGIISFKHYGRIACVVSMLSVTTFDRQGDAYKRAVLLPRKPRVAVEMASTAAWWKYGVSAVIGIDAFGESAPAPVLFRHFGFTPENVAAQALAVLKKR